MSIQFSGMEAAKRFFRTRKGGGELGLGELWASGAFAGVANTAVANPVEHIRIRQSPLQLAQQNRRLMIYRTPDTADIPSVIQWSTGLCSEIVSEWWSRTGLPGSDTLYAPRWSGYGMLLPHVRGIGPAPSACERRREGRHQPTVRCGIRCSSRIRSLVQVSQPSPLSGA